MKLCRNPPKEAPLFKAVSDNDMAALEKCLAKGADPNERDIYGRSAMDKAIWDGSIPFVKRLINARVKLNKLGPDGLSYLERAVRGKQWEIARLLLDAGALTNPPGNRFEDAIYSAIQYAEPEFLKLLVTKGSDPKHPGYLHSAVRTKRLEIVQFFLDQGADVNQLDFNGWTPLFWALFTPPPPSASFAMRVLRPRIKSGIKFIITPPPTPAHLVQIIKLLIEHGADVNHRDNSGRTPMKITRYKSLGNVLIEAGAKSSTRSTAADSRKRKRAKSRRSK
jgi:ankyrin repeat protein